MKTVKYETERYLVTENRFEDETIIRFEAKDGLGPNGEISNTVEYVEFQPGFYDFELLDKIELNIQDIKKEFKKRVKNRQ